MRGGKRDGAGRKPSGKSKVQFWVTDNEAEFLRIKLIEQRNDIENDALILNDIENKLNIDELKLIAEKEIISTLNSYYENKKSFSDVLIAVVEGMGIRNPKLYVEIGEVFKAYPEKPKIIHFN